jgi:NAD(P)H-dependent flavin oxidoreductase YrpB (nitropropane dioxygenase family)
MKKNRFGVAAAVLAAGILLAGCSSKVAETTQYSGFLQDYSKLQKTTTPSGHEVLRWIAPDFNVSDYRGIYVQPVAFYPPAKPNARVSQATLDQVREYANSRLKAAIGERITLLPNPSGKRVLIAKVAVTAVVAENEDMQFYEVVPVAAVIATTMAASGHRTQNAALFIEAKLIDQDTGKTVMAVVRKGYGKTIGNSTAPITFNDVKKGIDDMVDDIVNFPKQ